jgi:aldehyde:ferredoxin oxidoreductase
MEWYGWMGKYLSVDLTHKTVKVEDLDPDFARKYVGGLGFGMKILYDESKPGMDAFDPEIPLIFATGPVGATDAPASGGYLVITQSPLTNTVCQAEANGFFGYRLKAAGFDFVVFRGKAEKPVYLWVHDDTAELRDASKLWGKGTHETEELIKAEVGEKNASVASIGQAGESLVRYASINSDFGHSASSGGPGAVMGSKNLKAIAAFGNRQARVYDPERTRKMVAAWVDSVNGNEAAKGLGEYGTAVGLPLYNQIGDLPTNNLTTNVFPYADEISGVGIHSTHKTLVKPCYKCPINHCHWTYFNDPKYGLERADEPEYEGMAGFGSNWGIHDVDQILWLNHLADDYGMCLKSLTFVVGLMMECYEKELIGPEQLGGLNLRFGNGDAAAELMHKIAYREGIGKLLGENLRTIAETIGGEAVNMVVEVKGAGIQVHDQRSIWGTLLASAICDFSATICSGGLINLFPQPEVGFNEPIPGDSRENQAWVTAQTIPQGMMGDVFVVCGFPGSFFGVPSQIMVDTLSAITGEYNLEEFKRAMYRIENLARAYNIRHGLIPEDDIPSERLLSAPVDGGAKGRSIKPFIQGMVKEYYRVMGWDEKTSKPLRSTLKDLDLEYVIPDLWG